MLCLSFWRRDNASGVTYWVTKHYQGFSLCALPWVLISTVGAAVSIVGRADDKWSRRIMPNDLNNNALRTILPNFPNLNVTGIIIKLLGSLNTRKFNDDHTIMA